MEPDGCNDVWWCCPQCSRAVEASSTANARCSGSYIALGGLRQDTRWDSSESIRPTTEHPSIQMVRAAMQEAAFEQISASTRQVVQTGQRPQPDISFAEQVMTFWYCSVCRQIVEAPSTMLPDCSGRLIRLNGKRWRSMRYPNGPGWHTKTVMYELDRVLWEGVVP